MTCTITDQVKHPIHLFVQPAGLAINNICRLNIWVEQILLGQDVLYSKIPNQPKTAEHLIPSVA